MATAATGGGRYIMYDAELLDPPPISSRTRKYPRLTLEQLADVANTLA